MGVGTDQSGHMLSNVDLYPGGYVQSIIRTSDYCRGPWVCHASSAGLYDVHNSRTVLGNLTTEDNANVWAWGSEKALNQSGKAYNVVDSMTMNTSQGLHRVAKAPVSAVDEEFFKTPNSRRYSPQVGILSLGGPNGTKSGDNITGQTFPCSLAAHNVTPSNSFGLHYGSASLGLGGSLVWGGYDQSRAIGDIATFALGFGCWYAVRRRRRLPLDPSQQVASPKVSQQNNSTQKCPPQTALPKRPDKNKKVVRITTRELYEKEAGGKLYEAVGNRGSPYELPVDYKMYEK